MSFLTDCCLTSLVFLNIIETNIAGKTISLPISIAGLTGIEALKAVVFDFTRVNAKSCCLQFELSIWTLFYTFLPTPIQKVSQLTVLTIIRKRSCTTITTSRTGLTQWIFCSIKSTITWCFALKFWLDMIKILLTRKTSIFLRAGTSGTVSVAGITFWFFEIEMGITVRTVWVGGTFWAVTSASNTFLYLVVLEISYTTIRNTSSIIQKESINTFTTTFLVNIIIPTVLTNTTFIIRTITTVLTISIRRTRTFLTGNITSNTLSWIKRSEVIGFTCITISLSTWSCADII